MLTNTKKFLQIDESTFKEVEYLFVIFKSFEVGKVRVEALLYKNEEKFLANESDGTIYIADVNFNMNQEGLLNIGEDLVIKKFPSVVKCGALKSNLNDVGVMAGGAGDDNSPSLLSKMVGFLGFGNGTR